MSSYLESLSKWIQLKIYQLEVTYSVYIFTPIEKFIFCTVWPLSLIYRFLFRPRHASICSCINLADKSNSHQTRFSFSCSASPSSLRCSTSLTTCNSSSVARGSTCMAMRKTGLLRKWERHCLRRHQLW